MNRSSAIASPSNAGRECVLAGYTPSLAESYFAFARQAFGHGAYQAQSDYVQWLHTENTLSRGAEKDFAVLLNSKGQVVGCQQILRLRWRLPDGEVAVIPAPHNTMVLPEYRGITGGLLSARCYVGEKHALVPGSQGRLSAGLRKSGFIKVQTWWYRQLLRPVVGALRLIAGRAGLAPPAVANWPTAEHQLTESNLGALWCAAEPRAQDWPELLALANGATPGSMRLDWDEALFRWRFFHPLGPRHHFLALRRDDRLVAFALVSAGPRKDLLLGRVMELKAPGALECSLLLGGASAVARSSGAHILTMFCASPPIAEWALRAGWHAQAKAPDTFFFHRSKQPMPGYDFMAGAGDYGFEAIGQRKLTTDTASA